MAKTYVSKKEREQIMKILLLKEDLKEFTEFWKEKGYLTTNESRNLSSSVTFLDKGLTFLINNLDKKVINKIMRDASNLSVEFRTNYDVGGLKQKLNNKLTKKQRSETLETPIWLLEEFMDFSLNTCSVSCKFKGKASECPTRGVYRELNFEPFTRHPEGDNCEYYLPSKLQRDTLVDTLVEDKEGMKILVSKMDEKDREELLKHFSK